MFIICFS